MHIFLFHLKLILLSVVIFLCTLLIPQRVRFLSPAYQHPYVSFGYPFHFVTVDLTYTFPDYPSKQLLNKSYSITGTWEKPVYVSQTTAFLSFISILLLVEAGVYIFRHTKNK